MTLHSFEWDSLCRFKRTLWDFSDCFLLLAGGIIRYSVSADLFDTFFSFHDDFVAIFGSDGLWSEFNIARPSFYLWYISISVYVLSYLEVYINQVDASIVVHFVAGIIYGYAVRFVNDRGF